MKKTFLIIMAVNLLISCDLQKNRFEKSWSSLEDRVWVGSEFWTNRLQDWKIRNGRLECIADHPNLMMRTAHLVNFRLSEKDGEFTITVKAGPLRPTQNMDAAFGFLIGAGPRLGVWGASLVQQKTGPGAGLFAGLTAAGELFVRDMETDQDLLRNQTVISDINQLIFKALPGASGYSITVTCGDGKLSIPDIGKERLTGNIALVSHPGTGDTPGTFWFNDLEIRGSKLEKTGESFGPVISTQYTLSKGVLKMTAQMAPMGESDPQEVILEVKKGDSWQEIASAQIIKPGYTATFRLDNWDSSTDVPYRVKYSYPSMHKRMETDIREGTIGRDPVEKEEIVIAGFTGNHNVAHPGLSGTAGIFHFDSSGIWFPHTEVVQHVKMHQPDILFFSGDQVYEGASPTYADTRNYELDYLYKWYLWCLAYRDLTRDIPAISVPDDHDVYQGNLWGQGGRPTDVDNKGGYVHPAWFVQMVERTQCSNLPDPYDPTPVDQGIGVYYTSLTYGGIGFAILEDRKFKSGCADNPFITKGRPDWVIDPEFDVKKIDLPGKELLGERQLKFLHDWSTNWKGEEMKIALSQTIFAGMATHHGAELTRLTGDLDSNGWPQSGRNKAIDALRKAFAFHLAGDQHLASIVHHGIDDWGDGIYSFCVPSVANFYPRAWWPEAAGLDRPEGAPENMGKHKDGFGNYVTVYGVTNPTGFTRVSTGREPLLLHDKMPGYGIVKMNKKDRTIRMECWPRYADPLNENLQYGGWPKTISQFENYGRKALAYLPVISVEGLMNPVIEVTDEETGDLVYCVRIKGSEFTPGVFRHSIYSIRIKDTEKDIVKEIKGLSSAVGSGEKLVVSF